MDPVASSLFSLFAKLLLARFWGGGAETLAIGLVFVLICPCSREFFSGVRVRMHVLPGFLLDVLDDNWSWLTWGKGRISTGDRACLPVGGAADVILLDVNCRTASADVSDAVEGDGKNAPNDVEDEALASTKINCKATFLLFNGKK